MLWKYLNSKGDYMMLLLPILWIDQNFNLIILILLRISILLTNTMNILKNRKLWVLLLDLVAEVSYLQVKALNGKEKEPFSIKYLILISLNHNHTRFLILLLKL
jgi:hypothetical protein